MNRESLNKSTHFKYIVSMKSCLDWRHQRDKITKDLKMCFCKRMIKDNLYFRFPLWKNAIVSCFAREKNCFSFILKRKLNESIHLSCSWRLYFSFKVTWVCIYICIERVSSWQVHLFSINAVVIGYCGVLC